MTCVHGRLEGSLCPHCMAAPPSIGCLDCEQVTGGRCWRHAVTIIPAGTVFPNAVTITVLPND